MVALSLREGGRALCSVPGSQFQSKVAPLLKHLNDPSLPLPFPLTRCRSHCSRLLWHFSLLAGCAGECHPVCCRGNELLSQRDAGESGPGGTLPTAVCHPQRQRGDVSAAAGVGGISRSTGPGGDGERRCEGGEVWRRGGVRVGRSL